MKTGIIIALMVAAWGFNAPAVQERQGGAGSGQGGIIPLIVMDGVPVSEAVKNLARQAGSMNYIFDLKVLASYAGRDGEFGKEPVVRGRWTNVTASQALAAVLAEQKLKMVTNPATTVARVVFASEVEKSEGTNAAASGGGQAIPLIVMDQVPLLDAIRNLARQAQIRFELDPQLSAEGSGPGGKASSSLMVSIRWQNLTARQALDALLESHGIVLVEGANGEPARFATKAQAEKVGK